MRTTGLTLLSFLTTIFSLAKAWNVYVAVPSDIRLGVEEKIAIAVEGDVAPQHFEIYVQDHPGKVHNISHTSGTVAPNNPKILTIKVNLAEVPDYLLNDPMALYFVNLVVHSPEFHKEMIMPTSCKTGYVFVQTDKPIYTKNERVKFRIIPLNEDIRPNSEEKIKFQIKNPNGLVVQEVDFKGSSFVTPEPYAFPSYPILGVWSATVLHGYRYLQNTTTEFELQEYVLSTFTVKLKVQEVILPSDRTITISVEANFVYGKPVEGNVVFRLGIKGETPDVTYFAILDSNALVEGSHQKKVYTEQLKNERLIGWFPEIEGTRFVVEATVTDEVTGQQEVVIDANSRFASSPFVISFKRCLSDFKPGLVSVIEADILYVDGRPASKIKANITALADGNIPLKIINPVSVSNNDGKVLFEIQPEEGHKVVTVTIRTDEPGYAGSQAVGNHTQNKFDSKNDAYIVIAGNNREKPKVGSIFTEIIYIRPADISDVYYMVIARGRIVIIKSLPRVLFNTHRVEFMVTHQMVPSFRLVVFFEYKNELIADSLRIDVANECDPKANIKVTPSFNNKEPGSNGKIIIEGSKSTRVGLLAVDSAVYALSQGDQLTKSKMFKTLETQDRGCGPGGGLTTESVLGHAGVVMLTKNYSPVDSASMRVYDCEEHLRKKRDIANAKIREYDGTLRQCCALGMNHDRYNRGCHARYAIVKRYMQEDDKDCSQTFLECCLVAEKEGVTGLKLIVPKRIQLGRTGADGDELDFMSDHEEDAFESVVSIRSDFRETWLFEDVVIGPDGKNEFQVSLPQSITTWIIQAVAISDEHGMCVADPQTVESFKKLFVQLNLPYSVVRNEQIEIRATVFNYGDKELPVIVYMHGVKDLCSETQEGEKSERKRLYLHSNCAKSVSFPVIPLTTGVFDIKVTARSPDGGDIIIGKLNVVAEGETVEEDITVKLDPSNRQQRKRRHIETENYADSIDDTQNLQVTAIKLRAPDDFIPGTESCTITAIGDQYGPTVQTSLKNPEKLIEKPRGCAEQAIIYLAPALYSLKYLKATNKVTAEAEEKGYEFIRQGYDLILTYRKSDGSYGAWEHTQESTWLTAFIVKVFCQASELVQIDEEVMCSGVKWLVSQQQPDGSFNEHNPVYHTEMMGGVEGQAPMTAYVLITLHECSCDIPNLHIVKARALSYLEEHLGDIIEPLPVAISAYALVLSDSEMTQTINNKLLALSTYDADTNTLYWENESKAYSVEATGYGLLTQLLLSEMDKSNSIVNWLNGQRMASGSFKSTQDTIVALQALSNYAARAKSPSLNLVSNLTSSQDRSYMQTLTFNEKNSLVLQEFKLDKLGGTLFVNTGGSGVGLLTVKLRYNIPYSPERLCMFDIKVTVTEEKENHERHHEPPIEKNFVLLDDNRVRQLKVALDAPPEEVIPEVDPRNRIQGSSRFGSHKVGNESPEEVVAEFDPRNRIQRSPRTGYHEAGTSLLRVKRYHEMDETEINNLVLTINICVRYLGQHENGMGIVDVGIFSGFKANEDDLKELVKSQDHFVERYDLSKRGVVFYLEEVCTAEPYCFKFRVIRDYIVGNTQRSFIKVYFYYDPDESCTVFYSPDHNSPMLRKICNGGICQCAEGGCPPKKPFAHIPNGRQGLKHSACEEHDYVWLVKVEEPPERKDGFLRIKLLVLEVVKEGIEKAALVEDKIRLFLARDNCETAELLPDRVYMIMGKDGKKYENEKGEIWHRYLLDKSSKVHTWTSVAAAKHQNVMRALHWLRLELQKGCDL